MTSWAKALRYTAWLRSCVATNWCRAGTFVAPKSKRFEAIDLIILAMTAIAELTISANNFEILKSKFDGVVERLGTMAETQVSYRHGSGAHAAVEILLKGPEQHPPEGIHFFDKDGHKRNEVRFRW